MQTKNLTRKLKLMIPFAGVIFLLSGCAVISIADAVVGTTVSVGAAVVGTTVNVGSAVVGTTVDVARAGVGMATGQNEVTAAADSK